MIVILLEILKMDIKSNKKNPLIQKLFSKKYKPRIIKSKKGKGSFTRKKKVKD